MSEDEDICPCCGQGIDETEITEWDQEAYEKLLKDAIENTRFLDAFKEVSLEDWDTWAKQKGAAKLVSEKED